MLSPTLNCSCLLIIQSTPRCENNVMTRVTNMRLTYEPRNEKTCFMPYANHNDAGQPAYPRSLIGAFIVRRCLDSIIAILSKSEISRLKLAGLRVTWSDAKKAGFLMTWLTFKRIRSRHDWILKDVSVKHNSNALK